MAYRQVDLTGDRKGYLLVEQYMGECTYQCYCNPAYGGCGSYCTAKTGNLVNGRTKSCGCLKKHFANCSRKHGASANHRTGKKKTKEYAAWLALKKNQSDNIPDAWKSSFSRFLRDAGNAPDRNYRIARKDLTRPYSKANVEWKELPDPTSSKK